MLTGNLRSNRSEQPATLDSTMSNLAHRLLTSASADPSALAIRLDDVTLSYADLAGASCRLSLVESVEVPRRPAGRLGPVIGAERQARLVQVADGFRGRLAGRTIWNVSSTAVGGGVAEMLHVLVGYVQDLDIPIRWMVITGDAEFFVITKRLHNQIHGEAAGGPLKGTEAGHYAQILAANAVELLDQIRPGDLVLLHDPQTAGLAAALASAGARVAWRCHIGVDWHNDATQAGWAFLRPHLAAAEGYVFSRREYVPAWVPDERVWIIPPSIDPFSPKNQDLDGGTVRAILTRIGVLDGAAPTGRTSFVRGDGGGGEATRPAEITGDGRPAPADPLVVQVSRRDRLKDMSGVMAGFADYVAPSGGGYLVLAGPAVTGVADDPEGAAVYGECLLQWRDLPTAARAGSCWSPCRSTTSTRTRRWSTHCNGTPPSSRRRASPRGSA